MSGFNGATILRRSRLAQHTLSIAAAAAFLSALGLLAYSASVVGTFPGEEAISSWVQSWRTPWLDVVMRGVSAPGFGVLALVTVGSAATLLLVRKKRKETVSLLGATIVASVLVSILKTLVERPRPSAAMFDTFRELSGSSFPSGHVVQYVVFLGTLVLLLTWTMRPCLRKRLIQGALVLALVAIGTSRIYLGAHWFADVIAGYAVGAIVVAATVGLWRVWDREDDSDPIPTGEAVPL